MQIDSCVQIILITRFFYPLSVHKYNTIAAIKRSFEQQRYNFVREVISLEGRASRKKSFTHRLTPRYLCIRFNFSLSLSFFFRSRKKRRKETTSSSYAERFVISFNGFPPPPPLFQASLPRWTNCRYEWKDHNYRSNFCLISLSSFLFLRQTPTAIIRTECKSDTNCRAVSILSAIHPLIPEAPSGLGERERERRSSSSKQLVVDDVRDRDWDRCSEGEVTREMAGGQG